MAPNPEALKLIASIPKSYSSRLDVTISSWKGDHKVEIRDAGEVMGATQGAADA